MCRYGKHQQWEAKAISISHCRVDQGKIPLTNSFKITSRCRVMASYLVGGTELAPKLVTDEALAQKLQGLNALQVTKILRLKVLLHCPDLLQSRPSLDCMTTKYISLCLEDCSNSFLMIVCLKQVFLLYMQIC